MFTKWFHKFKGRSLTIAMGLSLSLLIGCSSDKQQSSALTIGILQTASHPALDRAREGFMQELTEKTHGQVHFVVQNAEGSIAQARSIAQSFHANSQINGIFAIATPAAQAAASIEKSKPIFFAAVTDPVKAGLTQANLCGTTDMIDVQGEIDMLQAFVPDAKRVAIVFNPAEINAVTIKDKMTKELEKRGVEVIQLGVSQESEMALAVTSAVKKCDVLLTPTDNTVALTLPIIARIARVHYKPLIVSDNLLVEKGALASRGVDYFQSGKKAAFLADEVFSGRKFPKELRGVGSDKTSVIVNQDVLHELELTVPDSWMSEVTFVTDRQQRKKG